MVLYKTCILCLLGRLKHCICLSRLPCCFHDTRHLYFREESCLCSRFQSTVCGLKAETSGWKGRVGRAACSVHGVWETAQGRGSQQWTLYQWAAREPPSLALSARSAVDRPQWWMAELAPCDAVTSSRSVLIHSLTIEHNVIIDFLEKDPKVDVQKFLPFHYILSAYLMKLNTFW